MGANPPPPPIKIFSKSGVVDGCSTSPSKIQGGLRPPSPLFNDITKHPAITAGLQRIHLTQSVDVISM